MPNKFLLIYLSGICKQIIFITKIMPFLVLCWNDVLLYWWKYSTAKLDHLPNLVLKENTEMLCLIILFVKIRILFI